MSIEIKVKKIRQDVIFPRYAHSGDAGRDLFSCEDYVLKAGKRKTFPLGFKADVPEGYVVHVWDKSGLASKHGIKTMAGVIDSSYRGEYMVVLLNTSDKDYMIKKGDKIAQAVITKIEFPKIIEVDELSETSRGEGGFGSTGVK